MNLLLCGVQSPVNIGMILRSAEVFRNHVNYVDTFGVWQRAGAQKTIADFACGALARNAPSIWENYQLLDRYPERIVLTTTSPTAQPLSSFQFRTDDLILIGNEYSGVPELVEAAANTAVRIEMPQGYLPKPASYSPIDAARIGTLRNQGSPSLNAAVATSILMAKAYADELQGV